MIILLWILHCPWYWQYCDMISLMRTIGVEGLIWLG